MGTRDVFRHALQTAGFSPGKLRQLPELRQYLENRRLLIEQSQGRGDFRWGEPWPVLGERGGAAGEASGQYFHQDLYVAQKVFANNPRRHVDVGSRVDGFVAHVASFREIEVMDLRPLSPVRNVTFTQRDIMSENPAHDGYTDSLSCLHAAEHFGLGRYGDPVDYDGHRKGFAQLSRMVLPGGRFYFSVPIGEDQRIEFDAHRVFSVPYLLDMVSEVFDVLSFAYIDDAGDLKTDVDWTAPAASQTFGLKNGCGVLELSRR